MINITRHKTLLTAGYYRIFNISDKFIKKTEMFLKSHRCSLAALLNIVLKTVQSVIPPVKRYQLIVITLLDDLAVRKEDISYQNF